MAHQNNKEQLETLRQHAIKLIGGLDGTPATIGHITCLATIVSDLIQIVESHIYHNDDPDLPV